MAKRQPRRSEGIIKLIQENYEIKTAMDIQEALKDMFSGMLETMLEGELEGHLGYEKYEQQPEKESNRRNGYTKKKAKSHLGEFAPFL